MSVNWYYQVMGEVIGPKTTAQIVRLAREGVVAPDTLVRKGEDGRWLTAEQVKGLMPPPKPVRTADPAGVVKSPEIPMSTAIPALGIPGFYLQSDEKLVDVLYGHLNLLGGKTPRNCVGKLILTTQRVACVQEQNLQQQGGDVERLVNMALADETELLRALPVNQLANIRAHLTMGPRFTFTLEFPGYKMVAIVPKKQTFLDNLTAVLQLRHGMSPKLQSERSGLWGAFVYAMIGTHRHWIVEEGSVTAEEKETAGVQLEKAEKRFGKQLATASSAGNRQRVAFGCLAVVTLIGLIVGGIIAGMVLQVLNSVK